MFGLCIVLLLGVKALGDESEIINDFLMFNDPIYF